MREKLIIEKYEKELEKEGFYRKRNMVFKTGPLDPESYFDYLLDCKLSGITPESGQTLWESCKAQFLYLQNQAAKASDDYNKMQNKVRHLEQDMLELRKEVKNV